MIHVTIFGGHDGRLQPDKRFFLTVFGGCDLIRPTIARQLLAQRQAERTQQPPIRKPFFLTIFAAVDIKYPTLAEEFLDLREMIDSGLLNMNDWEPSVMRLGRTESSIISFTLFGGFGEYELPSEEEEIDSLAIQRHLGNIPESAETVLQYGIGRRGAERVATLRRAILASV